jgi:hypothetical protein
MLMHQRWKSLPWFPGDSSIRHFGHRQFKIASLIFFATPENARSLPQAFQEMVATG